MGVYSLYVFCILFHFVCLYSPGCSSFTHPAWWCIGEQGRGEPCHCGVIASRWHSRSHCHCNSYLRIQVRGFNSQIRNSLSLFFFYLPSLSFPLLCPVFSLLFLFTLHSPYLVSPSLLLPLLSSPFLSRPPSVYNDPKPIASQQVITSKPATIVSSSSSTSSSSSVQSDHSPAKAAGTTAAMPTTHFSHKPVVISRPASSANPPK